jgi:hypothetical protein
MNSPYFQPSRCIKAVGTDIQRINHNTRKNCYELKSKEGTENNSNLEDSEVSWRRKYLIAP